MNQCSECSEWFFSEYHTCSPLWRVWCPEDGETMYDEILIRADDAIQAAENWAERDDSDSAEYSIVGGQKVEVHVMSEADYQSAPVEADEVDTTGLDVKRFMVSGETVAEYYATEIV